MSDLQIVLIVIGALIIVAVLILNWWQERRFHQQVESNFSHLKSDALLDDPELDTNKLQIEDEAFSAEISASDDLPPAHTEAAAELEEDLAIQQNPFAVLDEYDSLNKESIEEVYTETVFSELEHKAHEASHQHAEAKYPSTEPAELKPAQHEEIKAIFQEVFSNVTHVTDGAAESHVDAKGHTQQNIQDEPVLSLPAMLHAQMDLTAILYLAAESSVSALSGALNGLFDGYEKPVYVHVLDANKQWVLLQDAIKAPTHMVTRLACSLQLADRAGAVSRSVLNRFQLAVESLGLDVNAHVEWQSAGDALTAANALDAFCIEVDKTMGFHLVHGENGAFTGTKLRGLAEAQGLSLAADGTFKYFDEATLKQAAHHTTSPLLPSFIMFNRDQHPFSTEMLRSSVVKAVSFQLDIPHVKHCAEAFNHMVQVARQMEIGLNAVLVDDNNRVLSDIQIEKIRQQLKVIHATMLVRGIVPGSDSALRLFS